MAQVATVNTQARPSFTSFTPMEYMQIDVAGTYGLDKENWDTRIQWTLDNEASFEDIEEQGGDHPLVRAADEPALFYAAVCAYRKTQRGEPTGHMVSLDATASGIQILAALTGCRDSGELCNLVNVGDRIDAYTSLYEIMKMVNNGELTVDEEEQNFGGADIISISKKTIGRSDFKAAIMTSLYGSTRQPKRIFGKGAMLEIFYNVMRSCLPGAWTCNEVLKSFWQPHALSHDWVMPDNFHVHVKVMTPVQHWIQVEGQPVPVTTYENIGTEEGRSLPANATHSIDGMVVREMHRRCDYDLDRYCEVAEIITGKQGYAGTRSGRKKDTMLQTLWSHYENSGFLSARILDYIDIENAGLVDYSVILGLLKSMPEAPFKLISIHDCFRCHANRANDLRKQYNQIMSEIARADMLMYLATQITGNYTPVKKLGCIADDILEADYALS